MSVSEKQIINKIIIESAPEAVLFRCNTGTGWTSNDIKKHPDGSITIKNPRILTAGFGQGTPDIIGWTVKTITPDMVGEKIAVFTGIEVKTKTVRPSKDQIRFIDAINRDGGRGEFFVDK